MSVETIIIIDEVCIFFHGIIITTLMQQEDIMNLIEEDYWIGAEIQDEIQTATEDDYDDDEEFEMMIGWLLKR